jgi:hypothetical protein
MLKTTTTKPNRVEGVFTRLALSPQFLAAVTVVWVIAALYPGDSLWTVVGRAVGGIAAPVFAYFFVGALLRELRSK